MSVVVAVGLTVELLTALPFWVYLVAWVVAAVVLALGIGGAVRNRDRQTPQDREAEGGPGGLIPCPDAEEGR